MTMELRIQAMRESKRSTRTITKVISQPLTHLFVFFLIFFCVTQAQKCARDTGTRSYDHKGDIEVLKHMARIFTKIKQTLNISEELLSNLPCGEIFDSYPQADHSDPSNGKPEEFYERNEFMTFSEPSDHKSKNIIQFRVSTDTQGRPCQIQNANVMLKLRYKTKIPKNITHSKGSKRPSRKIWIRIYTVKRNGKRGKLVSSRKSVVKKTTWFKMDLDSKTVEDALKNEQGVLRFFVRCRGCKKGAKLILMNRKKKKTFKNLRRKSRVSRPVLVLQTKLQTYTRHRRGVAPNSCDALASSSSGILSTCCRRDVVVNLKKLGWKWLLAPTVIRSGYCQNNCGHGNSTCRPSRYSSMQILYLDKGVNLSTIPNAIVDECSCI